MQQFPVFPQRIVVAAPAHMPLATTDADSSRALMMATYQAEDASQEVECGFSESVEDIDEAEADDEWEDLKDTFAYMLERSHERSTRGLKQKSVLNLVIAGIISMLVFVGLYGLVSTFRVAKIYSIAEGECLNFGPEILYGPPTDLWGKRRESITNPEECGIAVAAMSECSRVFVWPKNGSQCRCCAYSGTVTNGAMVDPKSLLNASTEWDAYIFSYQKRDSGGIPAWCVPLLLWSAIFMTIASVFAFICAWIYMDNAFVVLYMCLGILFCFWYLYNHFKPNRLPLNYWHGSRQYFFLTPSVEEVWLTIAFAIALVIVMVLQCISGCFFRCYVRCCSLPESSRGGPWFLQPEPKTSGQDCQKFSYRPLALGTLSRRTFWYEGEKNSEGKPDGWGSWKDESFHGECLTGLWEDGRPLGKFCSRETGSGALFVQGPIGYVASRGDCMPGSLSKGACNFEKAEQRCGNVMVECSIAGGFFPFLPAIRDEEKRVDSIGEMINNVERQLVAFRQCQDVEEQTRQERSESSRKEYIVPSIAGPREAVVFVHGWASDMETALTKLSLMLFLGKVPDNFIPIVFGWSCGNLPAFFYVKNHSEEYEEDFKTLFREIAGAGIEKVHVICHSMGVQVWCKNCPLIADDCFFPCSRLGGKAKARARANETRVQLANVVFMNGEALVEELAEAASGDSSMLNYADRLSLYIDGNDVACLASQVAQSLMPWKYQAWRNPELKVKATKVLGRIVSDYKVKLRRQDKKVVALDGDIVKSVMPDEWHQSHVDGYEPGAIMNDNTCIDVIDCTNLDTNAGFSRHNYWGLNALMAEDIVSCITKCIPASQRRHLVRRKDNIYDYLSAPSIVTA